MENLQFEQMAIIVFFACGFAFFILAIIYIVFTKAFHEEEENNRNHWPIDKWPY